MRACSMRYLVSASLGLLCMSACSDDLATEDSSLPADSSVEAGCESGDPACDADGDGFVGDVDCDDADPSVNPGADEVCTAAGDLPGDENCNGLVDELATCATDDQDRDGAIACEITPVAGCDCNDCDAGIKPSAVEICGNVIDEDCDGIAAPCAASDADGDGFEAGPQDCDDTNPARYVGAPEQCDGIDDDCDGVADDGCENDVDADGWVEPAICERDASVNPSVSETCDGVDNDCDGVANEVYSTPTDSYPDGTVGCVQCPSPSAANWCDVDLTGTATDPFAELLSFTNCGGCRIACDPLRTDDCDEGTCVCRSALTGEACADGEVCCATGCEPGPGPCGR